VTDQNAFLLLNDPTLFALPHQHGFAGASWLRQPQVQFAPFRWSEPLRLLKLPAAQLGAAFVHYAQTNPPPQLVLQSLATPVTATETDPSPTAVRQRSSVRVGGDLAQRRWLNAPAVLRSWPAADVLTNSVVQVSFDADGQIFRASLLPPGSGSRAADQSALDVARGARFAPTARHSGAMTMGTMIFEWHAVPLAETNAAVTIP
jgi:TonB family protein